MIKTKVVIVIGPPGTGKGTQCKILADKYGLVHFSTGDLCREYASRNSDLGREIRTHMQKGNFVPDVLITELINQRLNEYDAKSQGVLLDGYPRTAEQATALLSNDNINVDRLLLLQSSDNVCVQRMLHRRTDPQTGKIYSLSSDDLIPHDQEVLNRLVRRDTDVDESYVRNRLQKYHMNLGRILQNFKGKIFAIDGDADYVTVSNNVEQCFLQSIAPELRNQKVKKAKVVEQCVICMSEPSNFLVVPCGHKCGCENCLSELLGQNGKCPICRGRITSVVQVYNSGIVDDSGEEIDEVMEDANVVQSNVGVVRDEGDGGWAMADLDWRNQQNRADFKTYLRNNIKISASPCEKPQQHGYSLRGDKKLVDVSVNVSVPDVQERVPIDVCCVIDISGSMGDNAKFQDPNDETKTISEGVTILDLVKHAVKTVINTLSDKDNLSIVSFDDRGEVAFALTEMTDAGKAQAITSLKTLHQRGNTNIWAGLECGLDSLRNHNHQYQQQASQIPRRKYVFLLTDGQPNQSPPKGEHESLKTYMEKYPDFKCQVNTFGFGYSLKSQLLLNISVEGNGTFSFIPDAKIVGTCFVNAIANASCTVIQKCSLHLTQKNNHQIGPNKFNKTPWGYVVEIGPLQFGQTRNVVIPIEIDNTQDSAYLDVVLEYDSDKIEFAATDKNVNQDGVRAQLRNKVVDTVYKVIDGCSKGNGLQMLMLTRELSGYVTGLSQLHSMDPAIVGLTADVSGRISKSISTTDRFTRWGQHYLRSVNRAHELQVCTNFMDMGLQAYGGTLFKTLVETGGEIFKAMPLEKSQPSYQQYQPPSQQYQAPSQYQSSMQQSQQLASSATYYAGSGGGCFDESTTLLVKRNDKFERIKIAEVRKGDKVMVISDVSFWNSMVDRTTSEATIRYVVRIDCGGKRNMVKFLDSGIVLTGNHPIRIGGKWQKPNDLVNDITVVKVESGSRYVYNLVLSQTKVGLLINEAECVTFGHQFSDAWHPIYASNVIVKTIESLSQQQGEPDIVFVTKQDLIKQ